jgi:Putative effector of murein hydrolase LrgA
MNDSLPASPEAAKQVERQGRKLKLMLQIGLVFGVCLVGQAISVFLPIAVPGSVISMVLLFLLLVLKIVKVEHIRQKADFLLQNMAFFFIPAGVGILANYDAVKDHVLPLLAVIVITSILTFGATALTVRGVMAAQAGARKAKVARMRKQRRLASHE